MALTLTSLEDYSLYGGGVDDDDVDRVTALLEGVEGAVRRWMRPGIVEATGIEYYDGNGATQLVLSRRPVTAIAGVRLDQTGHYGDLPGGFGSETELVAGEDYVSKSLEASESNPGMLVMVGRFGVWPRGWGNIRVEYTAGYNPIPPEITLAVNQLASIVGASVGKAGPVLSETIGRYSYSLLSGAGAGSTLGGVELATVSGLLAPYSKWVESW